MLGHHLDGGQPGYGLPYAQRYCTNRFPNILAYTGMRYNEVLTCKVGCANYKDDIYYITAIMTKTDNSKVEMEWFSNAEVHECVGIYEKYVIGMQERAKAVLSSCRANITSSQAHNLKDLKGLKFCVI